MRVLLSAAVGAAALSTEVTPVQKVITLLNGMLEKGKKERHEEQVQFAAYKQFCGDTEEEKVVAIKKANALMERLQATIAKTKANAERLSTEIADHESDISGWESDISKATEVRNKENADYEITHKDYSESIDALGRAITVLNKQDYDRKQKADALVQVQQKSLIPAAAKKIIDNFLQSEDTEAGPLDVRAPEANGYEFQSGGIIEMLEKLLDKFSDERNTLEKEEANAKHAFGMIRQDLTGQINSANDNIDAKKAERAENLASKAEAEGDLKDTFATRNDDQAYLDDLVATCKSKSADFEDRQKLRADEIEAIEKAVEIMSSGAVSGSADKHLPAMAQTSLLQLSADNQSPTQSRAAMFLTERANSIHSAVLSALAMKVESDPFTKVKRMIQDLITRLMEEAAAESEHKGWCDKELAVNKKTREEKTSNVESLIAETDELTAAINKLTKQIADLESQIADLNAALAEATKLRGEEKATNKATIKDAQVAQTAVAKALNVLKDFYAKAGAATALVQAPADAPEVFDKPYKGMQSENGGVVGMLEVIESDFARLEAETKSAEETAQNHFDTFATDTSVDIAEKTKSSEHKSGKKADKTQQLSNRKDDLEATQKDLNAALEYYDKLKPSCVNAGVSYDDRVKRREEEIQSLQEALKILSGEDLSP